MKHFDLIVIGSGSAGSTAAHVARRSDAAVGVVEKDRLGGECPHYACVPTKAMLRSAKIYSYLKRADEFGLRAEGIGFDWEQVAARRDWIINEITGEERRYEREFSQAGIDLIRGTARFTSEHTIDVDGQRFTAKRFVIATGSSPAVPTVPGLREGGYLTNLDASRLRRLPKSIAILGGGPVGVEFAQIYATFDVRTTLIQRRAQLVSREDPEIAALLLRFLQEAGASVLLKTDLLKVEPVSSQKRLSLRTEDGDHKLTVDEILVAVGRVPDIHDLALDVPGVTVTERAIPTDETLRTNHPDIWAAGDVAGKMFFTHVAAYEGYVAGTNAVRPASIQENLRVVPRVTFTDPEIASVGVTERTALDGGRRVSVRRYSFGALSRALIQGEARGFVKIVADADSDEILGGHIIGPEAGELIHEIAVAMQNGVKASGIGETIHAYPTLAEAVGAAH